MTERRVAHRYEVTVPVQVRAAGQGRKDVPYGQTRDISTSGLYFTVPQPLQAGSRIEMSLTLPTAITGGNEVILEVVARVVRVEDGSGAGHQKIGVAAHIEKYDIVRTGAAR
jgi:hypothetical protein